MQAIKIVAPTEPDVLTQSEFQNPDAIYRPMPVWRLNGPLETERVIAQLGEMHAAGAGGVFIQARDGLETPYLSGAWFEILRAACEEAKRLGMLVWLCDDFHFPSGTGNLEVSGKEEYRSRFVSCRTYEHLDGGRLPDCGSVLCAFSETGGEYKPLPFTMEHDGVHIDIPEGAVAYIFTSETLQSPSGRYYGVNVLSQDAATAFYAHTHERIKAAIGDLFGNPVVGMYTCESSLLPFHQDAIDGVWVGGAGAGSSSAVPWSDEMPGLLERHGQTVESALSALFLPGNSPEIMTARRVYWEITATCFATVFYNTYRAWCDENGLLLAGRPLFGAGLHRQAAASGDPFCTLASVHLPACLAEDIAPEAGSEVYSHPLPAPKTGITGPKLVSSAARLSGRARAMSEGSRPGGWGRTLSEERAYFNWQASLGINFIAPTAVMYSAEGYRKYDSPPGITQNPSYEHYRVFADYAARVCYAMSQGLPDAPIAVIYPVSPLQARMRTGHPGEVDGAISDTFDELCLLLMRLRLHYDLVDPAYLEDAYIKNGHMYIGDNDYIGVVLPASRGWPGAIDAVLRDFTASGGRVLCVCEDDSPITPQNVGQGQWRNLPRRDIEFNNEAFKTHVLSFFGEAEAVTVVSGEGSQQIYTASRHLVGERLWFFTNVGQAPVSCVIALHCEPPEIVRYDLETGEMGTLECTRENGQTHFEHTFLPGDALLIGLRAQGGAASKKKSAPLKRTRLGPPQRRVVAIPADGWGFALRSDNVLPITRWDFQIATNVPIAPDAKVPQPQSKPAAYSAAFSAASYLQMRPQRVPVLEQTSQKHGLSSHTTYTYKTVFNSNVSPTNGHKWQDDICLAFDDMEYRTSDTAKDAHIQVLINGGEAPYAPDRVYFEGMRLFRIGSGIRHGENTLDVIVHHYAYFGPPQVLTMPAYIVGGFRLLERSRKVALDAPEETVPLISLAQLGYPYYAGVCEYTREFTLNPIPARVVLCFEHIGDVLEIWVNNRLVTVRAFEPWSSDITAALNLGKNTLCLRVANGYGALFDQTARPAGIYGNAWFELYD